MMTVKPAIAKWLMISVIILGVSCRKDHGEQPPPPPAKEYEVITTGIILNPVGTIWDAYYWINDERTLLEKAGAYEVFPYGVEKVGNDLYIAGSFSDSSILKPCFWKNGTKKLLPTDGLDFEIRCSARDAKWFNNALYILGDADLHPVIWKVQGDQITIIPVEGDITRKADGLKVAMNLEVYNQQLYFAGAQVSNTGNGPVHEAGYWTMNQQDKAVYHVLESNMKYTLCYSMAVSGKGIFVAGEYGVAGEQYYKPAVWSVQGKLPVVNQVNLNSQRINEVVLDDKGKVYLNVLDYSSTKPTVWKTNGNTYDPLSPVIPATAKGYVNNLAMRDDNLAYGYTWSIGNDYYAGYFFNGKQTELKTPGKDFLLIHRTSLFPK